MLIPNLRVPLWLSMEFDMRAIEKFELVKWLAFWKTRDNNILLIVRVFF